MIEMVIGYDSYEKNVSMLLTIISSYIGRFLVYCLLVYMLIVQTTKLPLIIRISPQLFVLIRYRAEWKSNNTNPVSVSRDDYADKHLNPESLDNCSCCESSGSKNSVSIESSNKLSSFFCCYLF
jgi:hypothetical protein